MIQELIKIAKDAGDEILKIYNKDFSVEYKEDESPLTEADKRANEIIMRGLQEFNLPIISEENKEILYEERKNWRKFFLVDPLDGTKEFVKKNGEFTVNIALIENNEPTLGVVHAPVLDETYYSDGKKSYKILKNKIYELPITKNDTDVLKVVASKSHFNEETKEFIEKLNKKYELINSGSSLKICLIAEGTADIYPRLGPTSEWDTAAAHAVVKSSGKEIKDTNGNILTYNKEQLLNPYFIVE